VENNVKLSSREIDVLRGVLLGKTYPQIATDLGIGFETVKSYTSRLRKKLAVNTKVELALWASANLQNQN